MWLLTHLKGTFPCRLFLRVHLSWSSPCKVNNKQEIEMKLSCLWCPVFLSSLPSRWFAIGQCLLLLLSVVRDPVRDTDLTAEIAAKYFLLEIDDWVIYIINNIAYLLASISASHCSSCRIRKRRLCIWAFKRRCRNRHTGSLQLCDLSRSCASNTAALNVSDLPIFCLLI